MNILIKNAHIVTMSERGIIKDGYIRISGDKIAFVSDKMIDDFSTDYIIDGSKKLVIPGLINTHTHIPMSLLRGYSDGYPLHQWLFEKIFPIEDKLTAEYVYWGSLLSLSEMIGSGTTAFADMYFFVEGIAKATVEAGMRANLSRAMMDIGTDCDFDKNERVIEAKEFIKNWHNSENGRIKVDLSLHAVYTSSLGFIEKVAQMTADSALGMHIHISETEKENSDFHKLYGKSPTQSLYEAGFFRERTLAAHCVYLTDCDIEIFKKCNINIAHCPTSNLKLGSGIAPVKRYLDEGINVSLGTDGASSNNNQSILKEMNLAALLMLGTNKDPSIIGGEECLKMATINGAKTMGRSDVGMLKEGYKADITMLNIDNPHSYPPA